jgi:GDP-L-fucose synthase
MPEETLYPLAGKRVWVAGHDGMVGSALVRRLKKEDCTILTAPRAQVDLRAAPQVDAWLAEAQPQVIFLAAARVGGIYANDTRPAEFLYDNMMIEANVIEGARKYGVEKLLFLGSSCIYPRLAPQPLKPDALLSGALEPTNQWYAVAKIAGIKLVQAYRRQYGCDFISVMPTNLYGPHDNFDPVQGHVIPALIARLHQAKVEHAPALQIWGSGKPMREFLYVEDAADGMVHMMKH